MEMIKEQSLSVVAQKNPRGTFSLVILDLFKLQILLFPVSKKNLINRELLLKGDKEKKRERATVVTLPSCAVPVSVTKLSSQAFMWFSSHLSYPLPSVWLGWPWSPKSRSSPLRIRLLISPPVECVMPPARISSLSHIILLVTSTCFLFSRPKMHNSVTECCKPVFWYTA